jgi:surface antigen
MGFAVFAASLLSAAAISHGAQAATWQPRESWHPAPAEPETFSAGNRKAVTTKRTGAKSARSKTAVAKPSSDRAGVVDAARAIADGRATAPRKDCSGFVIAAYARAGQALSIPDAVPASPNVSARLFQWAHVAGHDFRDTPLPGDLAFFRDTYGAPSGEVTHVALVESVSDDGTVTLLNHLSGRIQRTLMNLRSPHDPAHNGYMRRAPHPGDPRLAGELFVAFGRP